MKSILDLFFCFVTKQLASNSPYFGSPECKDYSSVISRFCHIYLWRWIEGKNNLLQLYWWSDTYKLIQISMFHSHLFKLRISPSLSLPVLAALCECCFMKFKLHHHPSIHLRAATGGFQHIISPHRKLSMLTYSIHGNWYGHNHQTIQILNDIVTAVDILCHCHVRQILLFSKSLFMYLFS